MIRHPLVLASSLAAACAIVVACSSDSTSSNNASSSSSSGTVADGGSSSGSSGEGDVDGATNDGGSSGAIPGANPELIKARPYATTTPKGYDAAKATPLVVLLHGYTATAAIQDSYFGISKLAETKNFLVALPDGLKDTQGNQFWNATDACCDIFGKGVDDVAYLTAVIADMKTRFNVDPKRVYVIGHSNGGFMSHRLACELSKDIAGIVSLAGATYSDPAKCKATDPVAVLQVHGDMDETVAYGGGKLYGAATFPGAKETVATWAAKNGCGAELTTTAEKLDLDTGLAGDDTVVARHACTKGAAELWTITNGKHVPALQPTWASLIYGFLEAHPKP